MKTVPYTTLGVLLLMGSATAGDVAGFRGPARDGVYPDVGLLRSWPDAGPKLLWQFAGLGEAYSGITAADDTLYMTGKHDNEGWLFAVGSDGKEKWRVSYGPEADGAGFPGARSTPTVDGALVYITSGYGKVFAFRTADGSKAWTVDMGSVFGGRFPRFHVAESVLIDGDRLICTPGGETAGVVALNKSTGETLWQAKDTADRASYCSARIFDNGTHRQIVTLMEGSMVGIDPDTGALLWRHEYPAQYGIHAITPVFSGNILYTADGYKQGGRAFELAADGKSVKELWHEEKIDIHHGGTVAYKDHVYGASSSGTWACIALKTGEVVARFRDLGKGSVVMADGLLYGYDEKGRVGLIDPNPEAFRVISWFQIEEGSGQHWSHPTIHDKRLYIRHGNILFCYDIAAPDA